jgi:hypothetical protein
MRILAWQCGGCRKAHTTAEMMRAYRAGGCECGDNGSWERLATYPVRCAWCQTTIRYSPTADSHGICGACQRENFPQTVGKDDRLYRPAN